MGTFYVIPKDEDLQHYGILGMKWGVRRYQNADGSLTSEGRKRYDIGDGKQAAKASIVGTLAFGPLGGLAAGLYGRFASKEKVDKLVKVGAAIVAAELSVAGGGSLVSNFVHSHKEKIEAGKNFVDLNDYFMSGKKDTGVSKLMWESGVDRFEPDRFYPDSVERATAAARRANSISLYNTKQKHNDVDRLINNAYANNISRVSNPLYNYATNKGSSYRGLLRDYEEVHNEVYNSLKRPGRINSYIEGGKLKYRK